MKIRISLLTLLICLIGSVSAQRPSHYYHSPRGGSSSSSSDLGMVYGVAAGMIYSHVTDHRGNLVFETPMGFQAGVMWGLDLGHFEIVPEIWYQWCSTDATDATSGTSGKIKENNIEVPILFSFELPRGVRLNFGPSLSLKNESTFEAGSESYDMGITRSMAGYLVGVSVTLENGIVFDVRYRGEFNAVSNEVYISGSSRTYNLQSGNCSVNIGYRF